MKKVQKKYFIILAIIVCGLILLQFTPVVLAQGEAGKIYDSTYIDKVVNELKGLISKNSDDLKVHIATTGSQTDLSKQLSDTQKELSNVKAALSATQKELSDLKANGGTSATSGAVVFKTVTLPAGKILIGTTGTQILPRTANTAVIYTEKTATGGLLNMVYGREVAKGTSAAINQMLFVPKDDGRGIKAIKQTIVIVSGTYKIK